MNIDKLAETLTALGDGTTPMCGEGVTITLGTDQDRLAYEAEWAAQHPQPEPIVEAEEV